MDLEKETKYYWGKFETINGESGKVWTDTPMTKDEMLEFDDTFRHMCKYADKPI